MRKSPFILGVGLLAAATLTCAPPPPPMLVLITVDTLRSDHLGAYGYGRDTSPTIDRLAANGVLFETVFSAQPETSPAFASMMTGRWPAELGVRSNRQTLSGEAITLAERLSGAGWATAAFVSGFPLVKRLSGLDQGFGHYDDAMPDARGRIANVQRFAPKTTDAALAWAERELASDQPFFLWVHYYDPHGDYAPGAPYDTMFAPDGPGPQIPGDHIPPYQTLGTMDAGVYVARYDGEIRRTDDEVARLLDGLQEIVDLSRALVVLTADHGESLVEHDYFLDHGKELYTQSLHIPWILSGPQAQGPRRVAGIARTPDIAPTLLELLGQPVPTNLPGRSLAHAVRTGDPARGAEAYAEARFAHRRAQSSYSRVGPKVAVRDDRFTAVLLVEGGVVELYDRENDSDEAHDLLAGATPGEAESGALAEVLEAALRARLAAVAAGDDEPAVFDAATRARAEQLAAGRTSGGR